MNKLSNQTKRMTQMRAFTLVFTAALLLISAAAGLSQVTVKVDSTKTWNSWMNVFSMGDGYLYGQGWGAPDLRAGFVPNQATATRVVLRPNTNTYNPGDVFWNNPDGSPNKKLEANYYVESTALGGVELWFVGTTESNTLPAGWTCQAVIKEFGSGYSYIGDTRAPLNAGDPFTVVRQINPGSIVQYGFMLYGPNCAPGTEAALSGVSVLVDNADPGITKQPVSARAVIGSTATFSVTATGSSTPTFRWQRNGTNLVNGGNISGATTATLTISNAQLSDTGDYRVGVTNNAGGLLSDTVRLSVLTPADFANALDNPSFEQNVVDPAVVPAPWVNFSGSNLQNTNNFMGPDLPVPTITGTNVVQIYNGGEWNGIFQDTPCAPGSVFTGDMWLYQSAFNPLMASINEAFLEVQFRRGGENPIAMYQSRLITNGPSMLDTWLFLEATNGVAQGYAQTTTTPARYLVAPPGTEFVRFQLTLHNVGGGAGSVYVDDARLMKKPPVTVTAVRNGANVQLSWPTQAATSYEVVYKNSLSDATWTTTGTTVAGDGTVKSASFPITGTQRVYSVLTK